MPDGMDFRDHVLRSVIWTIFVLLAMLFSVLLYAHDPKEARELLWSVMVGLGFWVALFGFIVSLIGSYIAEDEQKHKEVVVL